MQPVKLGDVLVTTALLDDLRAAFPDAALDFLVGPSAAPLLDNNPLVRRRLIFTGSFLRDLRGVRQGHYDWVVDPRGTNGTILLALASGASVRAGFAVRPPRRLAYTHRLARGGRPVEYSVLERRRLLAMLGVPTLTTRPRLYLTELERLNAATRLNALRIPLGVPVIGITLPGGTKRREWSAENWGVAAQALRALGAEVLVFTGPGEEDRLARFHAVGGNAHILPCPLRELLALISTCSAFVSCDSGPAHFAMALGVPTVTIYPRGQSAAWNPGDPDTIALEAPPERPCPECALVGRACDRAVHTCVQSISPDDVAAAVRMALGRKEESRGSFSGRA